MKNKKNSKKNKHSAKTSYRIPLIVGLIVLLIVATIVFTTVNANRKSYAQITMEDGSVIVLELYDGKAPITVKNFKELANKGFYDGLIFHRVIEGFMIQGGDPTGTGYHGSDQTIKGEFKLNGVNNNISHKRGVISMARSNGYNSASSQFFICHQDNQPSLDGKYAAFGKVIAGMETVDRIATVETNSSDKPLTEQKMQSIRIIE